MIAMADIIALDDHRPHLVICEDGEHPKVHVLPVSLALDWASGAQPLPEEGILRRVITEWLACVSEGLVETALHEIQAEDTS